jgi:hypothetical protein
MPNIIASWAERLGPPRLPSFPSHSDDMATNRQVMWRHEFLVAAFAGRDRVNETSRLHRGLGERSRPTENTSSQGRGRLELRS